MGFIIVMSVCMKERAPLGNYIKPNALLLCVSDVSWE